MAREASGSFNLLKTVQKVAEVHTLRARLVASQTAIAEQAEAVVVTDIVP